MPVVVERDGGDLARTRRLGLARLEALTGRLIVARGRRKPCRRIVRQLFTALPDPAGVLARRPGALERAALLLQDRDHAQRRQAGTGARMLAVPGELGLTGLVTSITGLPAIGAAAILAETGDPNRFATAGALVKHAGLAPREKLSGTFTGRTKLTGQGRPGPRPAAWRGLGSATVQPGLPGPLPAPDQQGAEQAAAHPGADRRRRRDPAAPLRRDHLRAGLGPGHRHPRQAPPSSACRRLTSRPAVKLTAGASPPRH
jgi:hypothetical protein